MEKKILCGLDIGTNSVGWCVTDENNNVIKRQGKSLWGVRMFEEAKTAAERRGHRNARRLTARRSQRVSLLRSLFERQMGLYDNTFFQRLENSMFKKEDREIEFDYTLFNDRSYSDKQFFKDYKTIFHLRKHLVDTKEKVDLRFLYLVCLHIVKYRGNFLIPGDSFEASDSSRLLELIEELNQNNVLRNLDVDSVLNIENAKKINELFIKVKGIRSLQQEVLKIFDSASIDSRGYQFLKTVLIPLICGAKVRFDKLPFEDLTIDEDSECKDVCFKDDNYDEKRDAIFSTLRPVEGLFEFIETCNKIYSLFTLGKFLDGNKYISYRMVKEYDEHQKDLRKLKDYVKVNHKDQYNRLFNIPEKVKKDGYEANYSSYVGSYNWERNKKKFKHCNKQDFYLLVKTILNVKGKTADNVEDPYLKEVLTKMEEGTYLARQNSSSNGVLPYQLNLLELRTILDNQKPFYPFLNECDEDGTVADKIISLLTFRIPYYVGPLAAKNDYNHVWAVKKDGPIKPWNFDRMIDKDASQKEFIRRMLNRCTYLSGEYCLPKNSLLFSYYDVLNYVNKIHVNGRTLDKESKIGLIDNVFKKNRKVSINNIKDYFKSISGSSIVDLTYSGGKEITNFSCSLCSYFDFAKIFDENYLNDNNQMIENIIQDIVIFEDKSILEQRLRKIYKLEDSYIKKIKQLNYSGYGRLSRCLLDGIRGTSKDTGEMYTIIQMLENTNYNLMEIINHSSYDFMDQIDAFNKDKNKNLEATRIEDYVDELYISPGMKRGLIQAYKIVDEIEKIIKRPIDEYYVECNRSNKQKKKDSVSRKDSLLKMYKEAEKILRDDGDYKRVKKELNDKDVSTLQSDKYYLYFLQLGKCMYSGEPISLSELNDNSLYDIDHIIPQSLIKDDSITNRVLVKKELNNQKSDIYPIPQSILFKGNGGKPAAHEWFKRLRESKLINEEKYSRLMRYGELKDDELEIFVNRQLVFTNQAVDGFIKAIKYFKETNSFKPKIIYSKSENVSDFRKKFELVKSREANNFHHAHDAYLNIVVGRAVNAYFGDRGVEYFKKLKNERKTTNVMKIFDSNKPVIKEKDIVVWDINSDLQRVKKQLYERYDILTTHRTYVGTILSNKVSILPAGFGNIGVKANGPLADTSKYGGFKESAYSYYTLIEKNNKKIIEAIPFVYSKDKTKYLDIQHGEGSYKIVIPLLKINTVLVDGNKKFSITGKTNERYVTKNLFERRFDYENLVIIHKLTKAINKLKKVKDIKTLSIEDVEKQSFMRIRNDGTLIVSPARNDFTKEITLSNNEIDRLFDSFLTLFDKEIYDYTQSKSIIKLTEDENDTLKGLSIFSKILLLGELLKYLKTNERSEIDLTLINGPKKAGVLTFNSAVPTGTKIVTESITGFYKKIREI